jgi:hypothetical protein
MLIKPIYSIFLGLLLAIFVGAGIATFYEAPKYPEYMDGPYQSKPVMAPGVTEETPEQIQLREDQQRKEKEYRVASEIYHRNVSVISVVFSVILLVLGLSLMNKIDVISDGLLLGGVMILLYSIGRGFASQDNKYQFLVITIGLIIALILGYAKFIRPQAKSAS